VNVDFLLFDGMDLMDFGGPWEAFLTANRLLERRGQLPAFDLVAFSPDGRAVSSYGGLTVVPTGQPRDDGILIVPGTIDVAAAVQRPAVVGAIVGPREVIASVCTGAFLLDAAGILPEAWTTHWEDLDALDRPGGVRARVVDCGEVVTGGGIGCGVDVGLHLIARFTDPALARLVARQMDVTWHFYGDAKGGVDPVVVEQEIAAAPAQVYQALLHADFVEDRTVDPWVGGAYEYLFLDGPDGERGGEGCRILALEPERMLAFTWNSPPGFTTRGQHTWVVVTLSQSAGATRVRLAHLGHGDGPEWDANREYFRHAWPRFLQRLAASLG
jgi:uncharacterized protein YndB with AHSA1/START domain/putative intracellular protease/amidase